MPVDAEELEARHKAAAARAFQQFDHDKFGSELVSMSGTLRAAMQTAIEKEYRWASLPQASLVSLEVFQSLEVEAIIYLYRYI